MDVLGAAMAGLTQKIHTLNGPTVCPITRDLLPIGKPVVIESVFDRESGWEFDCPLHFMLPFHRHYEVGSISGATIDRKIEDIMIDLDCGRELPANAEAWPYSAAYLRRAFAAVRNGQRRKRWAYYKSTVIVSAWGNHPEGSKYVQYTVSSEPVL